MLVAGLVFEVIRNAEIFCVVAASLEMVDNIGSYSEMQIENFLASTFFLNTFFDFIHILIHRFSCHFHQLAGEVGNVEFAEVLGQKLGGVDFVAPKYFEAGKIHLIEHINE